LHFPGAQEFGRLFLRKQGCTYQQGGKIFPDDLFFRIQILQKSPHMIAVNPECRLGFRAALQAGFPQVIWRLPTFG